jgi:formylglycine-generating enzyme required for sulfatase activity
MLNRMLEKSHIVTQVFITFMTTSSLLLAQSSTAEMALLTATMVDMPQGSFLMGSDDARKAERPVHRVSIQAFKMAETEVTQQQWQAVMGNNPSRFKDCKDCPVEQVSWDDIQLYLKKLNSLTGKQYRLPTEAEWEYACRSGGKDERYCGGKKREPQGWYLRNSDKRTHAVKQKEPNGLGLYDMSGNVFEWTQDCWNPNYYGAPTDGSAWISGDCRVRVLRGGSWNTFPSPGYMRSVYRFRSLANRQNIHVFGFRVTLDNYH